MRLRKPRWFLSLAILAIAVLVGQPGRATTFTVVNSCSQTIYPAIAPAAYQNGGWVMTPNTTVTFTVPTNFDGRVWARKNCNTASPAQCDSGQCGGTGYQCAGTTGQGTTTLAEFNLDAGGTTDWYDISNVDAYDFPMALSMSNGLGYTPSCSNDVIAACPPALQQKNAAGQVVYCNNPCSVLKDATTCCNGLSPQACRDIVNQWPATAQQYVNDVHNNCGEDYTYPWDDWWGLHTVGTGSNWTITFCPNNVQPGVGPTADNWPLAATAASGTSNNGQVFLTWTAPVGGATSYNVYRSLNNGGNNGTPQDTPLATGVTNTSYTDINVSSGTTYYYIVVAHNAAGFSPPSSQITVTAQGTSPFPPAAPTNVSAQPASAEVSLSWSPSGNTTSYAVYRSVTSGSEVLLASGITAHAYNDTTPTNGTTYYYKVAAVNPSGTSALSTEMVVTPSTSIADVIAINAAGAAAAPFVADTDFAGGTAFTDASTAIDTTGVVNPAPQAVYQSVRWGMPVYTIPGLTAGTLYTVNLHFAELSWTNAGARVFGVTINGTTVLSSFDIFAATGAKKKAVIKSYPVTANGSGQIVIAFVNGGADNPMINGIEVQTTGGSTCPVGEVPVGTNLTATAGNAQVAVSWAASQCATSYNVYRATTSGGEGTTPLIGGLTGTSFNDTGLTNGTTYFYKVAAVNAAGTSAMSNEASATPEPPLPTAPTLTGSPGNAQAGLSWTASTNATSYDLYRGPTSGSEVVVHTQVTSPFSDTGLTNGTTYFYIVKAINSAGTASSNEVSVTPFATGGISINCGGAAAAPFLADTDFNGGAVSSTTHAITTTQLSAPIPPQAVLQTNRHVAMTYTIGGFTAGSSRSITLYLEEHYWTAAGKRKFNVSVNGTSVLSGFDIFAAAGGQFIGVQKAFSTTANASGQVVIAFTNVVDNALCNGIVVN